MLPRNFVWLLACVRGLYQTVCKYIVYVVCCRVRFRPSYGDSYLLHMLCCLAIFIVSRDFHIAKAKFDCGNPVFPTPWFSSEPPSIRWRLFFVCDFIREAYAKPRRIYCDVCRVKLYWTCGFSPRALLVKNKPKDIHIIIFIPIMLYCSKASPPH